MVGCDQCVGCGPHREHSAQIMIHNNCTHLMREAFVWSTSIIKEAVLSWPQSYASVSYCDQLTSLREEQKGEEKTVGQTILIPSFKSNPFCKDFFDEFPKINDDEALATSYPVHLLHTQFILRWSLDRAAWSIAAVAHRAFSSTSSLPVLSHPSLVCASCLFGPLEFSQTHLLHTNSDTIP